MPAKPDQEQTWSLGGRCHQNHVLPIQMRKGSGDAEVEVKQETREPTRTVPGATGRGRARLCFGALGPSCRRGDGDGRSPASRQSAPTPLGGRAGWQAGARGGEIPAHLSARGRAALGPGAISWRCSQGEKNRGSCRGRSQSPAPAPPLLWDTGAPSWARPPLGACTVQHLAEASVTVTQRVTGPGGQEQAPTRASPLALGSPWAQFASP